MTPLVSWTMRRRTSVRGPCMMGTERVRSPATAATDRVRVGAKERVVTHGRVHGLALAEADEISSQLVGGLVAVGRAIC